MLSVCVESGARGGVTNGYTDGAVVAPDAAAEGRKTALAKII